MAEVTTLVVQAIEDRIRDNIGDFAGIDIDQVAWQGMDYSPGESDWMRPVTLFQETEWFTSGTTGTGVNVVRGILTCTFFSVPGYGMSSLDAHASAFRALFDRVAITIADHGPLEFGPAGGPRPGPFDGAWLQNIVDCPFQIEEHGS